MSAEGAADAKPEGVKTAEAVQVDVVQALTGLAQVLPPPEEVASVVPEPISLDSLASVAVEEDFDDKSPSNSLAPNTLATDSPAKSMFVKSPSKKRTSLLSPWKKTAALKGLSVKTSSPVKIQPQVHLIASK